MVLSSKFSPCASNVIVLPTIISTSLLSVELFALIPVTLDDGLFPLLLSVTLISLLAAFAWSSFTHAFTVILFVVDSVAATFKVTFSPVVALKLVPVEFPEILQLMVFPLKLEPFAVNSKLPPFATLFAADSMLVTFPLSGVGGSGVSVSPPPLLNTIVKVFVNAVPISFPFSMVAVKCTVPSFDTVNVLSSAMMPLSVVHFTV